MSKLLDLFLSKYNYTDFHELNLDWLISDVINLIKEMDNFVNLNTIKYADPIQWDITKQYEKNTVVIDANTGTAYISTKPVPSGVALTNTDFWTVIFSLDISTTNKNITLRDDGSSVLSTFSSVAGDWLMWNGILYKVIQNIGISQAYLPGFNIERYTVEHFVKDYVNELNTVIGALDDLITTDKTSIVNAINEVYSNVGVLSNLTTEDKTSAVAAINEVNQNVTYNKNAIKEKPFINVKDYGAIGDGVTDDYTAFVNAISESYSTGSTVIVPDGNYYLSADPAVTDLNAGNSLNLLLSYNVEFSGPGAGNPNNPVFNGKLLSPVCNKGNRLRGFSFKSYDSQPSPSGNGSTLNSIEWIADTSEDYADVTGSIANGSYVMTLSSLDGVSIGAGVIPVGTITGFPDGSTKQNTVRVTAIDFTNNTIEVGFPDVNPAAWAGIATSSPWTGASITNQPFRIRKRAWNVTQFIGALAGSGNVDRIAYGQNIVTSSNGNLTYGIELDMDFGSTQTANADIVHKGLYVLGFGTALPLTRAISIEHSAANWSSGVHVQNTYHGIDLANVAGGIAIHNEFYDRSAQTTKPLLFGIKTDDIQDSELSTKLPILAGSQTVNGAVINYLKRNTDNNPIGCYIECVNAAANERVFSLDADGYLNLGANTINSGAVTDAQYHLIIRATDGHTYAVPLQRLT